VLVAVSRVTSDLLPAVLQHRDVQLLVPLPEEAGSGKPGAARRPLLLAGGSSISLQNSEIKSSDPEVMENTKLYHSPSSISSPG